MRILPWSREDRPRVSVFAFLSGAQRRDRLVRRVSRSWSRQSARHAHFSALEMIDRRPNASLHRTTPTARYPPWTPCGAAVSSQPSARRAISPSSCTLNSSPAGAYHPFAVHPSSMGGPPQPVLVALLHPVLAPYDELNWNESEVGACQPSTRRDPASGPPRRVDSGPFILCLVPVQPQFSGCSPLLPRDRRLHPSPPHFPPFAPSVSLSRFEPGCQGTSSCTGRGLT